uniref:Myb/SANT-like DNA-binding domain-containing protein n=1 Tax=Opuntia streptacantha TaxID=393608 RepID=A0A7C8ZGF2_OPUST
MEEEEETPSHASPERQSHSPPSGRITVTVAAAAPSSTVTPPPPYPHHNSLTLALPIQQPSSRPPSTASGGSGGGGGREDCWSEGATAVLIEAWGERYLELSKGNLKQKHWKEVADIVSSREDYTKPPKTDIQCKNRIDTVKKKYKIEKAKVASGLPSRWPFFHRLDRLLGHSSAVPASAAKVAVSAADNPPRAVPVGIPVGIKPFPLPHLQPPPHLQPCQQIRQYTFPSFPVIPRFNHSSANNTNNSTRQQQLKKVVPPAEAEENSADSLPPPERKRAKVEKGRREKAMREWGNSVRELTRAILQFGEAYEAAESAKLQQIMEMEKQRMKFAKELELQRMKFLMKTQLELSQLHGNGSNHDSDSRGGGSSGRRVGGGGGVINNNHHENHVNHANSDSSN